VVPDSVNLDRTRGTTQARRGLGPVLERARAEGAPGCTYQKRSFLLQPLMLPADPELVVGERDGFVVIGLNEAGGARACLLDPADAGAVVQALQEAIARAPSSLKPES
jgi:hypothetical protein